MIALIQRVSKASVFISNKEISHIDNGLLILLGIRKTDYQQDIDYIVTKIRSLRIFAKSDEYFSQNIKDQKAEVLIVSQFTLYADLKKGSRPSFTQAMNSKDAKLVYEDFVSKLRAEGLNVKTGEFGALMQVELVNDGPVTFTLTSDHLKVKNN